MSFAPELSGPSLVLIELPMGEGKTKGGDLGRLVSDRGLRGCYFALPTQATAIRCRSSLRLLGRRYPNAAVDVQLLHGHAALSAKFTCFGSGATWRSRRMPERKRWAEDANGDGVICWRGVVAAYRKRGLASE